MKSATVRKRTITNNARTQKRLMRVYEPEFSHNDYLPLEVKVEWVGLFRRKVSVKTLEDVWYRDAITEIDIPAGRESDLGSIWWPLWWLISPWDCALEFIFHDEGYRQQPVGISRGIWDMTLRNMMTLRKRPQWAVLVVYVMLRLFGGKAWRENARRNKRVKRVLSAAANAEGSE